MTCARPISSFRTACPSFGAKALTLTFRLKQGARVRIDVVRGRKIVRRVLAGKVRRAKHTYTVRISRRG